MEIFFIRHGETDWNAEFRYQGQRDVPLNATGRSQAADNGLRLARLLKQRGYDPKDLDWYCSPMDRAKETATLACRSLGIEPPSLIIEGRLIEISFGYFEGLLIADVKSNYANDSARYEADRWNYTIRGGENYPALCARVQSWLSEVRGVCVVVSHGGVARVLRVILCNEDKNIALNNLLPHDAILHIRDGDRFYISLSRRYLPLSGDS